MRYGSVCSGIGGDSVAWGHIEGWRPQFHCEIEPFCRSLLSHWFPGTELLGDFTQVDWTKYVGKLDLLAGGTPCQSFSVRGERKGLDDSRGDLSLRFFELADRLECRWFVWENVPGVLTHDDGRTFARILYEVGERGYGWAYRTLNARYFGTPQNRSRIVLVGHKGDRRPPAGVLFQPGSGGRDPKTNMYATPFHEKGFAGCITSRNAGATSLDPWSGEFLYDSKNRLRRMTVLEVERLQGFPDGYTAVPHNGKPAPKTRRYAALGNSWNVPMFAAIGTRIDLMEKVINGL